MSRLAELIARAREAGDPQILSQAIPYARFMGITFDLGQEEPRPDIRGRMKFSDALIGDPTVPALHGGTLGALLESTAIFQLLWAAETLVLPKIISITVEYLRPGQPRDTFARGIITRRGRLVANVRVEAWQTTREQPIAMAFAHFLLEPVSPSSGAALDVVSAER